MHFNQPKEFHDHLLLREFIKLLIEMGHIDIAKKLYDKYIEINDSSRNVLLGSNILLYFPVDYAMDTLDKIKNDCEEENIHSLIYNCPTINSDRFVDFCISLGNSLKKDDGFSIDMLFSHLLVVDCSGREKELITFLEEKLNLGYYIIGSLNVLANIGTDLSVDFLMKYLDSSNDSLKQKAFYIIRYIKERKNIDWYNDLEFSSSCVPLVNMRGHPPNFPHRLKTLISRRLQITLELLSL
ncbi:hypothetical protein LCGC14_1544480 [marine sediment metagenome]|uniref:Uncharacterized protein n=1 Tax=marine sediment metagenome TaxID=412755 RepID=A0A0F9LSV3_9ZZZZ